MDIRKILIALVVILFVGSICGCVDNTKEDRTYCTQSHKGAQQCLTLYGNGSYMERTTSSDTDNIMNMCGKWTENQSCITLNDYTYFSYSFSLTHTKLDSGNLQHEYGYILYPLGVTPSNKTMVGTYVGTYYHTNYAGETNYDEEFQTKLVLYANGSFTDITTINGEHCQILDGEGTWSEDNEYVRTLRLSGGYTDGGKERVSTYTGTYKKLDIDTLELLHSLGSENNYILTKL